MSSTFINTETGYRAHEYSCQHYTVCNKSDEDHHIFECKCDIIDGYSTTMIPREYMVDMEYIVEELIHALCDKCKYINDDGYWFDTDNIYLDELQEIVGAVLAKRESSSDGTLVDSKCIVESRYINTMRQIFQIYYGIEDYELNELIVEELNL